MTSQFYIDRELIIIYQPPSAAGRRKKKKIKNAKKKGREMKWRESLMEIFFKRTNMKIILIKGRKLKHENLMEK